MWAMPMLVITAMVGRATWAILVSSPGSLIPSSITAISSSGAIWDMVMGTPTWLLLLPGVLYTRSPAPRAAAIISLVVVFPTLPVIPTTGMESRPRHQLPNLCRAALVSSTRIQAASPAFSAGISSASCSLVNTAAAPMATTCSKKR